MLKTPKTIIAGNWKMNTSPNEGIALISEIVSHNQPTDDHEIIICPPFTHLQSIQSVIKDSSIHLGAQTVSEQENGPHTGDISARMLSSIGCKYVIIGHSERRTNHQETNALINKKIRTAIAANLTPILCVGESIEIRQKNQTLQWIEKQLTESLNDISINANSIIIAYEPIWAIGTGEVATPEQAQEVHEFIRQTLAIQCPLLYGGSVNEKNSIALIRQNDINGFLVGNASLNATNFTKIINNCIKETAI